MRLGDVKRRLLSATHWLGRPLPRAIVSSVGIGLISVFGVALYARYVNPIYAIEDWLAWPLLTLVGYVVLGNLGWFAAGNWVVQGLLGLRDLPLLEHAVLSGAVGVLTFTEVMYVAGALGWFTPAFAVALPLAFIALGSRELVAFYRRYSAGARRRPPASAAVLLLWAVGGALTFLIYLGALSPDSVNYDATWCHLTVAQDYAREGRIVPFPGDYSKNVPQLASIVYTWGFLVPGLKEPALRWMMALHQEFALFLWTLAGVAAAVRAMVSGPRLGGAWAALYLFPIIFVYDHNLGAAADHVAASFALPGLLAAGRMLERVTWQRAMLLVLCVAGGMLTKYQTFYWALPLLLVVGGKLAWLSVQQLRGAGAQGSRQLLLIWLVLLVGLPLFVSPHFLKNWIFYRDPVYPLAQELFPNVRPSVPNAVFLFNNVFTDQNWVPRGTVVEKIKRALELTLTFSFEPHYSFTKNFPVFGALFTLLLPALVFIRRRGPKVLGAFAGMAALFIWGLTFNVDRNLQVFMPILVATTAAILIEIWRLGWLCRVAVAPVVLFQVVWGADAFFYSSQDRIRSALDLIGSGYAGSGKTRFDRYRASYVALGKALPLDATVLLHGSHISLGIDRRLILDWAGFQGLISYSQVRNTHELWHLYRGLGVTHLLYAPGERPAGSIQEEIVFQTLVHGLDRPVSSAGGYRMHRLPSQPPPVEPPYKVLTLGLYGYGSGVFVIDQLSTNEYVGPAKRRYAQPLAPAPSVAGALETLDVDAVVVGAGASLNPAQNAFLRDRFSSVVQYSAQQTIYLPKSR